MRHGTAVTRTLLVFQWQNEPSLGDLGMYDPGEYAGPKIDLRWGDYRSGFLYGMERTEAQTIDCKVLGDRW